MLGHGVIAGRPFCDNLEYMQYQIDELPGLVEGYTSANSAKRDLDPESLMTRWRLDDEDVAYPMYELVMRNAKQLKSTRASSTSTSTRAVDQRDRRSAGARKPADIPRRRPIGRISTSSCITLRFGRFLGAECVERRELRTVRDGVPDILWCTEFAVNCAKFKNVYAELGTTFASAVITFPTVCAHLLGQFLNTL
jgi:hypothetical protein